MNSQHAFVTAAALALGTLLPPSGAALAADLDLTVTNVRGTAGSVMIAIYANADSYPKQAVAQMKLPATEPTVRVRVPGLPAGEVAVTILHDRNGNDRLDSNLLGIPTEPYGFSGNPRRLMGPATWDQSRVRLPAEGAAITVELSD